MQRGRHTGENFDRRNRSNVPMDDGSGQAQYQTGQSSRQQGQGQQVGERSRPLPMECEDNSHPHSDQVHMPHHGHGALMHHGQGAQIQHGHGAPMHHGHGRQTQTQEQVQMQRSLQASKQMLFGVFENVVSQLEELESRELGKDKKMKKSQIEIPDQSWKSNEDIQRLVEAQLLMFENQMKYCPARARDEAREQLIQTTLGWLAGRTDQRIPLSGVDLFATQLIEILRTGQTKHPDEFNRMPDDISQQDLQKSVEAIMHGNSKKAALDHEYKKNPNKQAALCNIRRGTNISEGAARVLEMSADLAELEMSADLAEEMSHYASNLR